MTKVYEIKCKSCPLECDLEAKYISDEEIEVKGNRCPRGRKFALDALLKTDLVLTGRVVLEGGKIRQLPVKTTGPIPDNRLEEGLKEIRKIKVQAPVKRGQVLIENFMNLNVDLISMRKA